MRRSMIMSRFNTRMMETLEQRICRSATPNIATATLFDGHLSFQGTDGAEKLAIHVSQEPISGTDTYDLAYGAKQTHYVYKGVMSADFELKGGADDVILTGEGLSIPHTGDGNPIFSSVIINGGAGNDKVTVGTAKEGFDGNAYIYGGTGNDTLNAKNAFPHDMIVGPFHHISLNGDEGNDNLTGSAADDDLNGGAGNDILHAGAGNDFLMGGSGFDKMYGEDGDDTTVVYSLSGWQGNTSYIGGTGFTNGGAGNDTTYYYYNVNTGVQNFGVGSGNENIYTIAIDPNGKG
jgi:Ca2+-binding RTX toxin-like protein